MKQNTATKKVNNKVLMSAFLLMVLPFTATKAQRSDNAFRPGIIVENYVNGNGHGSFYSFSASLRKGSSTFSAGTCLQKVNTSISGMRFRYSFAVTGPDAINQDDREELNFFITGAFYHKAYFSQATIESEGKISSELSYKYDNMRMKTAEVFGGIGYNFFIGNNICLRSFIGIGYYQHLEFNEIMHHDRSATVLMTGIGIGLMR